VENNFIKSEFSAVHIYHQNFGIAMDAAFAVTAPNTFMYYHKRDIVETRVPRHLLVYKLLIDEILTIFVIWPDGPREIPLEFLHDVNITVGRMLRIVYVIIT